MIVGSSAQLNFSQKTLKKSGKNIIAEHLLNSKCDSFRSRYLAANCVTCSLKTVGAKSFHKQQA